MEEVVAVEGGEIGERELGSEDVVKGLLPILWVTSSTRSQCRTYITGL